ENPARQRRREPCQHFGLRRQSAAAFCISNATFWFLRMALSNRSGQAPDRVVRGFRHGCERRRLIPDRLRELPADGGGFHFDDKRSLAGRGGGGFQWRPAPW